MPNIILSVLGLLLASATAGMSMSYAGDAMKGGADKALAASSISLGSQIASAVKLYDLQEGRKYAGPSLQGLVSAEYLSSIPENPAKAGSPIIAHDQEGQRIAGIPLGEDAQGVCATIESLSDRAGCVQRDNGSALAYVRI